MQTGNYYTSAAWKCSVNYYCYYYRDKASIINTGCWLHLIFFFFVGNYSFLAFSLKEGKVESLGNTIIIIMLAPTTEDREIFWISSLCQSVCGKPRESKTVGQCHVFTKSTRFIIIITNAVEHPPVIYI